MRLQRAVNPRSQTSRSLSSYISTIRQSAYRLATD